MSAWTVMTLERSLERHCSSDVGSLRVGVASLFVWSVTVGGRMLRTAMQSMSARRTSSSLYLEWKITRMCLAHDHYRHTGFHVDTFVESNLSDDATRQWQYDVSFATSHGVLEREMLPA
ncbi:hypothetical protein JG687_00010520 [Phytophthora cactorum]|uniref:Uncharacterized protein n=1 Tax=Phytophthora cactorum TaxID=29920 RepID=A0A8T1UC37_9STRA|nr:hypothetical protein JG687_00010520 [Phytophthora cactorum]